MRKTLFLLHVLQHVDYLAGVHSLLHGTTVADDLSTLANASLTSNLQESCTGPCEEH